jgi:hypothetical protein
MFTYNFRRLLNLIGITLFKKLCLAIKNKDLSHEACGIHTCKITKDIEEYILVFGYYLAYFLQIFYFYKIIKKISDSDTTAQ